MVKTNIVSVYKVKLLEEKSKTIARMQQIRSELNSLPSSGDEADQSQKNIKENHCVFQIYNFRKHLAEIESALARIQLGYFGVCEETDEPIEPDRLAVIPWTRFSIEGAEIREALNKKYAG